MTNTTIPPAIARLLALGPLPSQMSARAAADVLGGSHRLEYVLHLVEVGDLASWTHSPTHGDQWHWKGRCGNEKILPRIAPDTDPDDVVVTGEDVLWHWCVLLEEAIHGTLPPKDAVEQRLAQVRNLQREHALGTLAAPTEEPPQAVPAESSASTRPGKVWTAEKLAEAKAYREKYGTRKTAAHYQVSEARIRALLPSNKPRPKDFSVFTHRMERR